MRYDELQLNDRLLLPVHGWVSVSKISDVNGGVLRQLTVDRTRGGAAKLQMYVEGAKQINEDAFVILAVARDEEYIFEAGPLNPE